MSRRVLQIIAAGSLVTIGSACQTRRKSFILLSSHKRFSLPLICVVRRGRQESLVTATTMKGTSRVTNLIHRRDRAKRIPTKETRPQRPTSLWIQPLLKAHYIWTAENHEPSHFCICFREFESGCLFPALRDTVQML